MNETVTGVLHSPGWIVGILGKSSPCIASSPIQEVRHVPTHRRSRGVRSAGISATVNAGDKKPGEKKPIEFEVKDVEFKASGPYVHENLTVFLLHAKDQDARDYLTLDQGLDQKLVSGDGAGTGAGRLADNREQERQVPVPSGRRPNSGRQAGSHHHHLSRRFPRKAARCHCRRSAARRRAGSWARPARSSPTRQHRPGSSKRAGQRQVHRRARRAERGLEGGRQLEKGKAQRRLGSSNTNSSLNEALDSAQVKKVCDACAKVMNELPKKHPDAIGVAIAVNGKMEEVNIYPNAKLFAQIFPRLVQSYAIHAALEKDTLKGKPPPAVASEQVSEVHERGQGEGASFRGDQRREPDALPRPRFGAGVRRPRSRGSVVHRQWINKAVGAASVMPRREAAA